MRKIFSFLTAILFAGSMMADSFAPKALADISADDVVIVTMTNANGTYALANDKSTSAAPVAVAVTVTDGKISTDVTNILWKITKDGNNLSITAGENQLYCTNSNNGVRVGTTTGTFIIKDDYLCCTSTSSNRYLGVYNNQDWRCYTTINSNITGQTLAFYVKEGAAPAVKYYMKNNWDAAADWTWKEMTKDGDNYKLESVVFGGTGVNYNTAADDNGSTWVPVANIAGDKLAAKDTVNLVLNPTAGTVTATIVGKYTEEVATTKYYMKNNWDAATDWTWKEMTKDGDNYKLTSVVFGGTGVNYNTATSDDGATWVPVADIAGDKLAAKDTVNLVLNPTAGTVTAAIVGKYAEPVTPPTPEKTLPVVSLAGTMNEWAAATMANAEDSLTASIKVALEAKKYEFKIVSDDKWLSLNGEGETLYGFHRDWTTASHINGVDVRNFELTADVAGDYTFTWTYADSTLAITFPAKEEPAKETLNAFPAGKTDFTTYTWGEDVAKNKVIFDDNNYIMMYSQGNPLVINSKYGLQIGNSSKVSAFVFRVGETTDITVDLARNGSDVAVTLYYMGATVDTLTSANLTAAGVECAVATISEEVPAAQLVKKDAAAGYYKVVSTLRFCVPAITLGKAPVVEPAKYYLTGDSALVVDAGLAAEKAWDPMAIKSETDTFALSLKANQEYKLKLIEDGDWKGGKVYGYDALTVKADGLSADADGNIVFKLNTASAVQVVYFWEEVATDDWKMTFKLLGDFYVAPEPPVVEHTYTVAGGSDIAFGTTWNPANTDNDMVKQEDGTYKWEKTELTLPAGAIEFKVCEDHAWTTSWPAQNYNLAIAEAGIYTITITFNPAAEENKVAAVATKTGSAVVDPTVSVKGSWDGWANELKFTLADNKETANLTVENIKAGTYEFKVILNGSDWRSNAQEFTRENASATGISGNNDANMKLVADAEGTYTFTWTFATNALNITFPKTGTGIDNTADGIKAVKVIRDGQLLIIKGDKTFNTQGQIVK